MPSQVLPFSFSLQNATNILSFNTLSKIALNNDSPVGQKFKKGASSFLRWPAIPYNIRRQEHSKWDSFADKKRESNVIEWPDVISKLSSRQSLSFRSGNNNPNAMNSCLVMSGEYRTCCEESNDGCFDSTNEEGTCEMMYDLAHIVMESQFGDSGNVEEPSNVWRT